MNEEKFKIDLVADFITSEQVPDTIKQKAMASLAFPETKQADLQYIKAILVSTGVNANNAKFTPVELLKAFPTISHKAIDLEHDEQKLVGHLCEAALLGFDGTLIDAASLAQTLVTASVQPEFDIAVIGVIYKERFPEMAEEISKKEWKVSMECWYTDFDLQIGDVVITRNEAKQLGYDGYAGKYVRVKSGNLMLAKMPVVRVLKNIMFSGMGMVKNPAGPRSVVLETAGKTADDGVVGEIDMTEIEKIKAGAAAAKIVAAEGDEDDEKKEKCTYVVRRWSGMASSPWLTSHTAGNISVIQPPVEGTDYDTYQKSKLAAITHAAKTGVTVTMMYSDYEFSVATNTSLAELLKDKSVRTIYEVDSAGNVVNFFTIDKVNTQPEIAAQHNGLTPGNVEGLPSSYCVSYKKELREFNGNESTGKVLKTHWCSLFEEICPVTGASAKSPACLRNKSNRTSKEDLSKVAIASDESTKNINTSTPAVDTQGKPVKSSNKAGLELDEAIAKVTEAIFKADDAIGILSESGEKWTRAFINKLPDASFAVVEKDIAATNKSGRHLPHHGMGGGGTSNTNLDLPHLRNAMARAPQIQAMGKTSTADLRKRAVNHLNKHRSALETARVRGMISDEEWASIESLLSTADTSFTDEK